MRAEVQIVERGWFGDGSWTRKERCGGRNPLNGRLEVLVDVRPKVQFSAHDEHANYVVKERLIENAAFTMPFLPPRIRKIDVYGHGAAVGEKFTE